MGDFRAVIFDFDGTLFDTRPAIIRCVQHAFKTLGRTAPAIDTIVDTIKTGFALHDTLIALDANLRGDRPQLDSLVRIYREIYASEADLFQKPYPGVKTTLQELQSRGIRNLIVSNKGLAAIHRPLDENGLSPFIDAVFGDDQVLPKKPDSAILTKHILPRYPGVSNDQILIVGDTETDIQFAKAAQSSSCWASYGYGEAERCLELAPNFVISTIEQLPTVMNVAPS
jgi:phosphoglycolate phosphatase